jgi:hypothetical protein
MAEPPELQREACHRHVLHTQEFALAQWRPTMTSCLNALRLVNLIAASVNVVEAARQVLQQK